VKLTYKNVIFPENGFIEEAEERGGRGKPLEKLSFSLAGNEAIQARFASIHALLRLGEVVENFAAGGEAAEATAHLINPAAGLGSGIWPVREHIFEAAKNRLRDAFEARR
jgi:hypothetical protein